MTFTSVSTKLVPTSVENAYKAFTEKEILENWISPRDSIGKVQNLKASSGGGYDVTLHYYPQSGENTSLHSDMFRVIFEELIPYKSIRQLVRCTTTTADVSMEMRMVIKFEDFDDSNTKVTILFTDIPESIDPIANEESTNLSLEKLVSYFINRTHKATQLA